MAIKTYGTMAVDWEQRIDFDRLRRERLDRVKAMLKSSEMGSVLCFDMNNVRYITSTHIGTWAIDKLVRFTLLPQGDDPIMWDFGSAARHHKLYNPWLGEEAFYDLDAPVRRQCARDVPIPFSPVLEDVTVPTAETVYAEATSLVGKR